MTITSPVESAEQPIERGPAKTRTLSAEAPFVRNAWYVIAARDEFDRTLKQRWVLGEPLCFFEAADGQCVVLDDRCAHRRYPLSCSNLQDDDTIQCKYHGFTYGSDGRCVLVPGGGDPRGIGVRKYPAVQRGPFVWIWTGSDPDNADETLIPWPSDQLDQTEGQFATGYYYNKGNYCLVLENLLDLTHLQFLHGIGGLGFTGAKLEVLKPDQMPSLFAETAVGFVKEWDDELGQFAANSGDDPTVPIRRRTEARVLTPGFACGSEAFVARDSSRPTRLQKVVVPQAITPANTHETHQFWMYWQNVPLPMSAQEWSAVMATIFVDDEEAVERIQQYIDTDSRQGVLEHSTPHDVASLRIRRTLHRLAAAEQK